MPLITDPVEKIVAAALDAAGIGYVHEMAEGAETSGLDFRLEGGVHIECKRFHSDRIARQSAQAENVIVIQGMDAAKWFAAMLSK